MSSFGEELRRERELRQITLREISEATKISLRYLDALENNDFRHLPGGVFNKGFVRAYAQHIGVDPETMVNAYLLEARGQQEGAGTLDSDVFRPPSGTSIQPAAETRRSDSGRLLWVVLAGVVVVAAIASVLGWWLWSKDDARRPAETEAVRQGSVAMAPPRKAPSVMPVKPEPTPEVDPAVATASGSEEFRVVLRRPTQGRLNCDNRRVEILDGLTVGTELVFRCRRFLQVDALDGGALLVQQGHSPAASLGGDGVPVMSRYRVPPNPSADREEP